MSEEPQNIAGVARTRAQARTLMKAGWLTEAINLLQRAVEGDCAQDVGVRIDLAEALLAAGRIEDAEAVRLPGAGQ